MRKRSPSEVSAGGVLARRGTGDWEICLVRARQYWGLPKGHVEAGETPAEAALREISEECGIPQASLSIVGELPASEYVYRRGGRLIFKLVHHFLVITPPGTELHRQVEEIDETAWLSVDDALGRASFADTRVAIDAAVSALVDQAV